MRNKKTKKCKKKKFRKGNGLPHAQKKYLHGELSTSNLFLVQHRAILEMDNSGC